MQVAGNKRIRITLAPGFVAAVGYSGGERLSGGGAPDLKQDTPAIVAYLNILHRALQ
jgi:hypothetical protein